MDDKYPKTRGITRLKYEHTSQGWWARYTRDGTTFSEVFKDNDPKYGSKRKAWEAAKKWHEDARQILPPLNRKEYAQIEKKNNTSGHTGVYKSFTRRVKGKRYFWAANWTPKKGKHQYQYFYIDEHGEEKAKQLAIETRKAKVAKIEKEWEDDYWVYRGREEELDNTFFFDVFAFEGDEKYKLHKFHERNQEIRKKKLENFLEKHGYLFCEICGFDFEKEYGEIGQGLIEVHHTVSLAEMETNHLTTLDELMCVCSNCHFVIHNGDHLENLRKLHFIYKARKKKS